MRVDPLGLFAVINLYKQGTFGIVPAKECTTGRKNSRGRDGQSSVQNNTSRSLRIHEYPRKLADQLQSLMQQFFPIWMHRRHRQIWECKWGDSGFDPFWKTDQPQKELVEAIESGWFPKNQPVIDLGCGNGEVSRWLASQGFSVLGLDYSVAAIANCRALSAGRTNGPIFEVADLCGQDLQLPSAASLIDRGCFHRIVENLRPIYARNIIRATAAGSHFLLLAATFKDARAANYPGIRSEQGLQKHVQEIFGKHFTIEKAEPTSINASKGRPAMPAVAFWMVRQAGAAGQNVRPTRI